MATPGDSTAGSASQSVPPPPPTALSDAAAVGSGEQAPPPPTPGAMDATQTTAASAGSVDAEAAAVLPSVPPLLAVSVPVTPAVTVDVDMWLDATAAPSSQGTEQSSTTTASVPVVTTAPPIPIQRIGLPLAPLPWQSLSPSGLRQPPSSPSQPAAVPSGQAVTAQAAVGVGITPAAPPPPPPPPPLVTTVRRRRNNFEGHTNLFANSSSEDDEDTEEFLRQLPPPGTPRVHDTDEYNLWQLPGDHQMALPGEEQERREVLINAHEAVKREVEAKRRRRRRESAAHPKVIVHNSDINTSSNSGTKEAISTSSLSTTATPSSQVRFTSRVTTRPPPLNQADVVVEDDDRAESEPDHRYASRRRRQRPPTKGGEEEETASADVAVQLPLDQALAGPVMDFLADRHGTLRPQRETAVPLAETPRAASAPPAPFNRRGFLSGRPQLEDTLEVPAFSLTGETEKPLPTEDQQHPQHQPETAPATSLTFSITVRGMSPLHADGGVVHPFVRIWLVHCVTGENLVAPGAAVPCAITQPFDLRQRRSRSPWWEAEVALRLRTDLTPEALKEAAVLLEVLDCGNETIHGFFVPRFGLYPICWGYYLLYDCYGKAHRSDENVHVQLFPFPLRAPWYVQTLQAILPFRLSSDAVYAPAEYSLDLGGVLGRPPHGAPPPLSAPPNSTTPPVVFQVFKNPMNRKVTYAGGLVISVKLLQSSSYYPSTTDMLPYEEYLLNLLIAGGGSSAVPRRTPGTTAESILQATRMQRANPWSLGRSMLTRSLSMVNTSTLGQAYYRLPGERTLPPTSTLQIAVVSGRVTCVAFSHNGSVVALGITRHLQYVVELRNPLTPEMGVQWQLPGHMGHIHEVVFQRNDRTLLSCSSDKTVRVWRPATMDGVFDVNTLATTTVVCVSLLSHGFPVYCAIFHQEHIITGGFDAMLRTWRFAQPLADADDREGGNPAAVSAPSIEEVGSSLRLTATFTPGLESSASPSSLTTAVRGMLGELVHHTEVDEEETAAMVLSLASNESGNRVWSVNSHGVVICWRAVYEKQRKGNRVWQMTERSREDCPGAKSVQVAGDIAIVAALPSGTPTAPVVYVFHATSCEHLRLVRTRLPANAPVCLLPDGEAFAAGTADGKLAFVDCKDGSPCSAQDGYAKVQTKFPVDRLAWAAGQQLALLCSPSPCPRMMLPNASAVLEQAALVEEQKATPGNAALPQREGGYGVPMELTAIAVVGTVRDTRSVIIASQDRASEQFCAACGGEVVRKRKSATLAARTLARKQRNPDASARRVRLQEVPTLPDVADFFAHTAMPMTDFSDRNAKMSAIVNFWKGLVTQRARSRAATSRTGHHPIEESRSTRSDDSVHSSDDRREVRLGAPPIGSAHRVLQYTDLDTSV